MVKRANEIRFFRLTKVLNKHYNYHSYSMCELFVTSITSQ